MVLATRDDRFIHTHPISEIRLLYEPETLQGFEGPIDTCHSNRFAIVAQGVVDLLSRSAATLSRQLLDDAGPRNACPETCP